MRPSEADASINLIQKDASDEHHFVLSFTGMTVAKQQNFDKMGKALGCDHHGMVAADELDDLEDMIDRALSLAPRARAR